MAEDTNAMNDFVTILNEENHPTMSRTYMATISPVFFFFMTALIDKGCLPSLLLN